MRIIILPLALACFGLASAKELSRDNLLVFTNENPGGGETTGFCEWDAGTKISYQFESTSKGNGILALGGQKIHLYDAHNDGSYFEDSILKLEILRIDTEPVLRVTGAVCWTSEKGDVVRKESIEVRFVLRKNAKLEVVYENDAAKRAQVVLK